MKKKLDEALELFSQDVYGTKGLNEVVVVNEIIELRNSFKDMLNNMCLYHMISVEQMFEYVDRADKIAAECIR